MAGQGKYLRAKNCVSGQEGFAYMIRGKQQIELFNVKKLEADIKLTTEDVRTIGNRLKQTKVVGSEGTGKMTVYYVDSKIRNIMSDYINKGIVPYVTIIVQNNDPTSSNGKQTTMLKNVLIKGCSAGQLDTDTSVLTEEMEFEFSGFEILDNFDEIDVSPEAE